MREEGKTTFEDVSDQILTLVKICIPEKEIKVIKGRPF